MKKMNFLVEIIIFVLTIVEVNSSNNSIVLTETKIIKLILNSSVYDKAIRPIDLVKFSLTLSFRQIVNLDEKALIATTSSYLFLEWIDERLQWNRSDFDIDYLSIQAKKLWLPDLFVLNTAESNGFIPISDSNLAYIQPNGNIYMALSLIGT